MKVIRDTQVRRKAASRVSAGTARNLTHIGTGAWRIRRTIVGRRVGSGPGASPPTLTYAGSTVTFRYVVSIRGLSVKFEDTVNTEAKTSNNIESFLFILLRTI